MNKITQFLSDHLSAGYYILIPVAVLFLIAGIGYKTFAQKPEKEIVQVKHPEWSKNANIYEVNLRQFSTGGTFKEFARHIPRLKSMGVDILWFMPLHPIGVKNRKGTLGSYYSVKDYLAIDPSYGTMDDFKNLVDSIHKQGMHVIIDWVANHTSWDNKLIKEHPDWYKKDSTGKFVAPYDWTDVVCLDYKKPELRKYMTETMCWWVKNTNIDGFRCDVAGLVPVDFWMDTRKALDQIKPVFMLAEAEEAPLHQAFDMTYTWDLYNVMNKIAKGEKNANDIAKYLLKNDSLYPQNAYRMYFTSNHDENSWNGTEYERLGDGAKTFAVLTATLPGMPLIYTGQEMAFNKRLRFFEKDTIIWKDVKLYGFYKNLLTLKVDNKALWNGEAGGKLTRVNSTNDKAVFAFLRQKDENTVFVILNLTAKPQTVTFKGKNYAGDYKSGISGKPMKFVADTPIQLKPWDYLIFKK